MAPNDMTPAATLERAAQDLPAPDRDASHVVVVGGGIAGIVGARLLADKHANVTLIERDQSLGGLMRSFTNEAGQTFDHGTHYALATNEPELDRLLFDDLLDDDWHVFEDSLREGHYFNGKFNRESGCLDARSLPENLYRKGIVELLGLGPLSGEPKNLDEYLRATYGNTFTDHIYAPVMKKLTGSALCDLHPDAHRTFSLTRLIGFDSFISKEIKKSSFLDAKLAYSRFTDGRSTMRKYYPKAGGVGRWAELLVDDIARRGVDCLTERFVSEVKRHGRTIRSVVLDDGREIACDRVVWTVPTAFYLRAAGINVEGAPPMFRNLTLLNFTFDQAVQSDLHWICCYDSDFATYRVTLYPNITLDPVAPPPHHLTVEVIGDAGDAVALKARIKRELVEIGLLPANAKAIYENVLFLPNAFPVTTTQLVKQSRAQYEAARDSADNLLLLGRTGGAHFQTSILREIHSTLSG
ncbi:MAG: FAD-dependent oxidoreductase [Minwuiales bacterium]|nr:FAD-dependent oxidoreductase [Minwuiales bacterium]